MTRLDARVTTERRQTGRLPKAVWLLAILSIVGCRVSAIQLRVLWPDEPRTIHGPRPLRWDGSYDLPETVLPADQSLHLSEYFLDRFMPLRLLNEKAAKKTVLGYLDALRWATSAAGDQTIADIARDVDVWFAKVRHGLASDTYCRSSFTGAPTRSLSAATQAKHIRQLRAILRELGPEGDGLLRRIPRNRGKKAAPRPKSCYTIAELRAVVAAAVRYAEGQPATPQRHTPTFWRAWYGTLFYTGLRRETALALRWRDLEERDGKLWFNVDGELNTKTGKPLWLVCHPLLESEIRASRPADVDKQALVLGARCTGDHLYRLNAKFVRDAGITPRRGLDLHGVRRTLDSTAAMQVVSRAVDTASALSQHSDASTTIGYYVDKAALLSAVVPQLPPLW